MSYDKKDYKDMRGQPVQVGDILEFNKQELTTGSWALRDGHRFKVVTFNTQVNKFLIDSQNEDFTYYPMEVDLRKYFKIVGGREKQDQYRTWSC